VRFTVLSICGEAEVRVLSTVRSRRVWERARSELVKGNAGGRMIALWASQIAPLAEAILLVDPQDEVLEAARAMGTGFGDVT
jgi:hypothetical protein